MKGRGHLSNDRAIRQSVEGVHPHRGRHVHINTNSHFWPEGIQPCVPECNLHPRVMAASADELGEGARSARLTSRGTQACLQALKKCGRCEVREVPYLGTETPGPRNCVWRGGGSRLESESTRKEKRNLIQGTRNGFFSWRGIKFTI